MHTPSHPHGTVSNLAASGSACVNREQQHPPTNLRQAQTTSLSFFYPSICPSSAILCLSQSFPPSSSSYSHLAPLSIHFGGTQLSFQYVPPVVVTLLPFQASRLRSSFSAFLLFFFTLSLLFFHYHQHTQSSTESIQVQFACWQVWYSPSFKVRFGFYHLVL